MGGIRERRVAKAAERKPIRPRTLEVREVKELKEVEEVEEVKNSEAESSAGLDGAFAGEAELVGS